MSPSDYSTSNAGDELRDDEEIVKDSESEEIAGQEFEDEKLEDEEFTDDAFDDDVFEDELYDDEGDESTSGPRKKKRRTFPLHCFNCNRKEGFFMAYRHNWIFSYFQGFSFGLVNLIGPFKCQCCGRKRFFCADYLHPKIWFGKKGQNQSRL